MLPGSISDFVSMVEKYVDRKPMIYCANGNANTGEILECKNLDEFVRGLSYWSSWSAGIGFWKQDIHRFDEIELYDLMPNASMIFDVRSESEYVICNQPYMKMKDDSGKGGYDLFQTFAVGYLDIINDLRFKKRISQDSFIKVKDELYFFLSILYLNEVLLPTNHTFIIGDVCRSLSVYYSKYDYYKMVLKSWIKYPYRYLRLVLNR